MLRLQYLIIFGWFWQISLQLFPLNLNVVIGDCEKTNVLNKNQMFLIVHVLKELSGHKIIDTYEYHNI